MLGSDLSGVGTVADRPIVGHLVFLRIGGSTRHEGNAFNANKIRGNVISNDRIALALLVVLIDPGMCPLCAPNEYASPFPEMGHDPLAQPFLPNGNVTPKTTLVDITAERPEWSGQFKSIAVATDDIIRIVTPFKEPRVVTTSGAEIQRSQHVLYVLPENRESISMFVTDAQNEASSISLTLKPEASGVREVDVAKLGQGTIKAASAPSEIAQASKSGVKITVVKKEPDPWEKPCRLCRDNDDSGSSNDDYDRDDDKSW